MDSFEWNKILGAILGTLLFLFVVKEAAHIIYPGEEPEEELAYKIEIPETEGQPAGKEQPEKVDFGTLLQQASAEQGEMVAKRCLQCHTFEKGGPAKTGPNLWGILGSDVASKPDFRYSNALSQLEGEWTYERVYEFVGAPSRYVPGTNMNFAGLRRQQERIDLLAYLRTMTDAPPPLPEPLPAAEVESGEAPAGEGETEGEEAPDSGADATEAGADEKPAPAEGEDAAGAGGEAHTPEGGATPEENESEGNADAAPDGEDGNGAP